MSKTTNRTTATAADFVEYVAEARAEGKTDAQIVERWMRQARPELVTESDPPSQWSGRVERLWLRMGDYALSAVVPSATGGKIRTDLIDDRCEFNKPMVEMVVQHSLEYALAWLANQLADRCPVAAATTREESCGRGTMIRREWQCRTTLDHPESPGEYDREAASLRRMFGIAEPGEVTP